MMTFLQINFLLGMTGILFVVFQKVQTLWGIRTTSIKILRLAQILFVLSLLTPIALKAIPKSKLTGVSSSAFRVYGEGMTSRSEVSQSEPSTMTNPTSLPPTEIVSNYSLSDIFFFLWIFGSLLFLKRFIKNYLVIRKTLKTSILFKKRSRIRIVLATDVLVPFSVRLINSFWIVLPLNLLSHELDLKLALKHELQHHRQGDTTWAMAMELLSCFFFFNPAIYLWKNIIVEFQEYSCDEALTGQKDVSSHDYGSCLLRVAETALNHRQMYVGTTSMAAIIRDSNYFKKFLLRRIEMITEEKTSKRTWMSVCLSLTLGLTTIAMAVGAEKLARANVGGVNSGTLIVDPEIQKIADDVLIRALSKTKSTAGFVIVSDPQTGKILAVANVDLKKKRLGKWALHELMETASISKPLVVAQALEEKVTTLSSPHNCEKGRYKFNGVEYRDWKTEGWETLTTTEAIELSSNICLLKIAEKLGESKVTKMLDSFGFGEGGTASDLPEARSGERPIPGPQYLPQVSSGFGFKSSPLEVLQAYGAIANGGELMKPTMNNEKKSETLRRILSEDNALKMRELLENVVKNGTGRNAQSKLYTTAGKTATSRFNEFMDIEWYGTNKMANYAGFIGFAPVSNPKVEVFVGLMNPNTDKTGAHGGEHAAPVFREVVENVLTHLKVAPDKI